MDGLQLISERSVPEAARLFAESFVNEPLLVYLFPDTDERKESLQVIFQYLVRMNYFEGGIYATSDAMEGLICVSLTTCKSSLFGYVSALLKTVRMPFYLRKKTSLLRLMKRAVKILPSIAGIEKTLAPLRPYVYVDMVAVGERFRGKGYMGQMMRPTIELARKKNLRFVLLTETLDNVEIYKHYGFKVNREIRLEKVPLSVYVMVLDNTNQILF